MSSEVLPQHIREAAKTIRPIAYRTPVLTSRGFDAEAGVCTHFKCENLQRGGAFKIRGASNFIFSLSSEQLRKGVVAYSSGNHAQAVAIAARFVGAPATLVMPDDAPLSKLEATRAQDAKIITYDRHKDSREAIGAKISADTGATLVPPFDHAWIIAGQGTAALELVEDVPQLDALITPVGGGGLLAGCSIATKGINPNIRIFGAEPELANDTFLSMAAGERTAISSPDTIADGLRSTCPGAITFPILQRMVEKILLVSEEEIKTTVKFLLTRMKILVEPSGAAAAAAVLYHKLPEDVRSVGVILSGGNMDFELLSQL